MLLEKRIISLIVILFSMIFLYTTTVYAKTPTRNVTVQMNKPEIIWRHWIVNTQFDKNKVKCMVYKPPDMRITRKPAFGKIKFKKGVVIDNDKLSGDNKKNCKGKVVKATAVEFTGDKKGKVSFKVEVFYRRGGGYEEYIFGTVLFNVNVR
jgi:hypothetical protein